MILFLVLFIFGLIIGIKVMKAVTKKKQVPIEEGGVPTIDTKVVETPIKAVKIAGVRIDIEELKKKSSNIKEGLKNLIVIER